MEDSNSFSYWTNAKTVIRLSNAKYKMREKSESAKVHSHPAHEFLFVKKGRILVHIREQDYLLEEGEFFAVPSSKPHSVSFQEEQNEFINVMFRGKLFPKLNSTVYSYTENESEILQALIKVCSSAFSPIRGELAASLLTTLLCTLEDRLEQEFPDKKHLPVNKQLFYTNLVSGAIEYLEKHFAEKVTLEQTASSVGISSSYLRCLLLKETGKSFSQHLLLIRISHARQLIENSPENIKSIAQECGFNTLSFFYRTFKRYTGVTPMEYARSFF